MRRSKLPVMPPISFLESDGKLPGFAQRRLDSLIAKKKSHKLTSDEARELSEMLDYIDRKSIEMLRHRIQIQRKA